MKKSRKSLRLRKETIKEIPQVKQAVACRWKLLGRVTAAAAEEPVTRGNLLSAVTIATTTTQVARIFMSCRVRRVRIWQVNSSSTNPLGISSGTDAPDVMWESDLGDIVKHLRPQMGTEPGYADSYAPKNSLAGMWSITGIAETDVLFRYNCAAGAIIQVDMDAFINDSSLTPTTGVSSGRTVGQCYYALGSKINFLNMNA